MQTAVLARGWKINSLGKKSSIMEAAHHITLYCRKRTGNVKNNLELYLNDVYEKECVFKIEDEEIEFIMTGIETLVQNIVDKVLEGDTVDRLLREHFISNIGESCQDFVLKSFTEVYFPISKDSYFQQLPDIHVQANRNSIIKVGSFYEGTKNGFPDEFDFIFLLYSCTVSFFHFLPFLRAPMTRYIRDTLEENKLSFCYPPTDAEPRHQYVRSAAEHNTRRLSFDKYLQKRGPAYTLQFIYRNCDGQRKDIHVDLVPAAKVDVSDKPSSFPEEIKPKSFSKEVMSAESFIQTLGKQCLSLTQTEVHFMKRILSKKHMKVYRILKFLINGHGDGEKLNYYCMKVDGVSGVIYSSYKIKTMMIYHHDECANSDTENIGSCVIQVLEEMYKYEEIVDFPQFTDVEKVYPNFNNIAFYLFPYLQDLGKNLKKMQSSQDIYDFVAYQIVPLFQETN